MKYTMSEDGIERATVTLRLRFTREEIATAKRMAKASSRFDWRQCLALHAALGIEGDMDTFLIEEGNKP